MCIFTVALSATPFFHLLHELYNYFSTLGEKKQQKGNPFRKVGIIEEKCTLRTKNLPPLHDCRNMCCLYGIEHKFVCLFIDALKYLKGGKTQKSGTRAEARGILIKLRRLEIVFMAQYCEIMLLRLHQVNRYVQDA